MATVTMPQLGESVTEGTILQWMKQPGDVVQLDDPLCEIETEKVTAELPSPFEGRMGAILVPEGETVAVGAALCEVEEGAVPVGASSAGAARNGQWTGGPMAIPPDERPAAPRTAVEAQPAVTPAAATQARPEPRERFYSPVVLKLAAENRIDLTAIHGTGAGGRVTRKDVQGYLTGAARPAESLAVRHPATAPAEAAATGAYEVVPLTPTRKTIAEHLRRSNLEAPQAWTMVEADVSGLVRRREREKADFREREGIDLTLFPYFTQAVCEALRAFPTLNARWEGDELRRYHALNLGVAVAAEQGLVVPVLHNAGDLSLAGIARGIAGLAERAHARTLRVEDISGGTFTVNNTGAFGSIASKPIVNWPQVGIVTMERAVRRPIATAEDAIAIRWVANVCLSFDHRALDGLEAGGFLAKLKGLLEAIGE